MKQLSIVFLAKSLTAIASLACTCTIALYGAEAQTDLRISGPTAGFPVAVPQMCNSGGADQFAIKIPELIAKDLDLSGLFQVLNPNSFVEAPGKCTTPEQVAFTDWSVIGAEGLVKGQITASGSSLKVELYLFDVQQKKAVLGKRYEADVQDFNKIAHRFANEIVKFFTGEEGIFGTSIAFVSRVGRFKEIFVMDLDGSNLRQITRDRGLAMSPEWSPNGDSLVYMSYRTKRPQLYIASAAGTGTPRQITNHGELVNTPEFYPDGTRVIASASFGGFSNLVNVDLKNRVLSKLTSGSKIDVSPSLSPDGSQVAYTSNQGGGPQIYVTSTSGGNPQRISFTGSNYCTSPTWSPKGDKIAFTCLSGGNQVYVANADGGRATQMTYGGNNEDPSWSPDGRYLVFSSDFNGRGTKSLAILPIVSAAPKPLAIGRSDDTQPAWSPRLQ